MGQFPTNGMDGGGSLRPQRPTTVRGARDKRLRDQGVDPGMLRESMDQVRFSEQRLSQMARRAALLRSSGRGAEAEGIVQQIRQMRDDPNRAAGLRQFGRDLRLTRGTVGDLPAEQQRANAISNERSMNDSLRAAYGNAGEATDRRRQIILNRKAQAGRSAAALTLDGQDMSPEQAAAYFDAVGPEVQQRVTRGVPIGDASRAEANEAGLAGAVERGITLDRTPRAPRELDPARIAQIKAEQAIMRRRQAEGNASQNAALDIAEDQRVAAVNTAEGLARATDTAGQVGGLQSDTALTNARLNDEMARVALAENPTSEQAKQRQAQAAAELKALEDQNAKTRAEIDAEILQTDRGSAIEARRIAMGLSRRAGATTLAEAGIDPNGPLAQSGVKQVVDTVGPMIQGGVKGTEQSVRNMVAAEGNVREVLRSLETGEQRKAYARLMLQELANYGDITRAPARDGAGGEFVKGVMRALPGGNNLPNAIEASNQGNFVKETTQTNIAFRRLIKTLQDAAAE